MDRAMSLIDFIISEGGDPAKTEVYTNDGKYLCNANDPSIVFGETKAKDFKVFPCDQRGSWVVVNKVIKKR